MIEKYIEILKGIGNGLHFGASASLAIAESVAFVTLLVIGLLLYFLARFIISKTIHVLIKKTPSKYDDFLIKNKVFVRICLLIPAILIKYYIKDAMPDFPDAVAIIVKITKIYEITVYASILTALVNTAHELYNSFETSKLKPIEGLVQVIKGIIIAVSVLLIATFLLGKSLYSIIIGLGTISAVLMLIFQDSIKGFVGSIQLSINDMLRIGDWIVMGPADGTVQEINLTTVKVQNWDNTITTIPTYTLVSSPFTNWRGMSESGGRRIARSINIDVNTIRYCTPEMLDKYKHYALVKDYICQREEDIAEYNEANRIDTSEIMNGRQQTNLGIFRAYIKAYLNNNPKLNHNLTMMVRQLQPSEFGVPLQIYAFSSDKQWINYEEIQSDIFDHIIAAAPMFDLKIYQKH
ncbi:MAG: mechanosensitive ion channel [Bacteroidales bacterium]|jgi:miniconductance mechanosensitive channel|nr:mechanosensitive ion channel [Bacteroidales bacterium]